MALTGAPNLLQKEMAALLYAGPGSLITGPMALMHHGLRSPVMLETVDLLVPAGRQRHSTGFVRLHRTHRMPSRFVSSGPRALRAWWRGRWRTPSRLLDRGAGRAGRGRGCGAAGAVQPSLSLAAELKDGPMRGSATFRSVLGEVAEGIRSTAEGDLRDLIRAARLADAAVQRLAVRGDVFIARPDAWWPEAG